MIHRLVSLPNSSIDVKDGLLVVMKKFEEGSDLRELGVVQLPRLREVAEIHECMDSDDEGWWHFPSNYANNKPLDVAMRPPGDLLESRDAVFEILEANHWLDCYEVEVEFFGPNSMNGPLDIVIPKLFMPVMKGLWGEEGAWI